MDKSKIRNEISVISESHGVYVFDFINLLVKDLFESENKEYSFIKSESWHNLNLEAYDLWAVSDNGDYFWWNGSQTVVMNPRSSKFISLPSTPRSLIKAISKGYDCCMLPEGLGNQNA